MVVINQLVQKSFTTFSWGNKDFDFNWNYLKKHPKKFNTLFIGSSRIGRHIDAALFDDALNDTLDIRSFVLSSGSLFGPELYYLFRNILESNILQLRFIFIEISDISYGYHNLLHTLRGKYWYNLKDYIFAIKVIINSDKSFKRKSEALKYHTICYLEKLFNIGIIEELIKFRQNHNQFPSELEETRKLGHKKNGTLLIPDEFEAKTLNIARDKFLSDTSDLILIREANYDLSAKQNCFDYDVVHLNYINKLIDLSNKQNVHLIFLLPPRQGKKALKTSLNIYKQIFDDHKIEVADSKKYPELYLVETSYDNSHLLAPSAKIMTQKVAECFKQLISRHPELVEQKTH